MHPTTERLFAAIKEVAGIDARIEPGRAAAFLGEKSGAVLTNWRARGVSQAGMLNACQKLAISPKWLATGDGDMIPAITTPNVKFTGVAVAALGADDDHADDYIQIRESEVRFAAGNGRTAHYDELAESVPATYRLEWFNKEGINPANARRFKVDGHSMEPFLFDSDTVLVNLGETNVTNGKVYALRYGDELRIKRVYKKLDGGLILHSDNPDHLPRDEELTPAMTQEHITIIGRVRDKSGTGGL
jgi:phage repressor protein C with HTH and peptisase S24 domain